MKLPGKFQYNTAKDFQSPREMSKVPDVENGLIRGWLETLNNAYVWYPVHFQS